MNCQTGKIRYPDETTAKVALVETRARGLRRTERREQRAYPCQFCDGWHLTSSANRHAKPSIVPERPVVRAGFVLESPLITFRRHAEADLKQTGTSDQLAELHTNPALWYRALCHIKFDVQNHIATDRRRLAERRPAGPATEEYLAAKRDHDARTAKRLTFVRGVERRIEEVRSLLGSDRTVDRLLVGDVVAAMLEVAEMAGRGDLRAVREKATFHATRWAEAVEAPDA